MKGRTKGERAVVSFRGRYFVRLGAGLSLKY